MKNIIKLLFFIAIHSVLAQTHIDQNGLGSSVTGLLSASGTQARQFEVAKIGYNSHHWQQGGIMIIELFETSYSTGYDKYFVSIGHGSGTQGSSPKIRHVESKGETHFAKVELGTPVDLATSRGGYVNKIIPLFINVRYYSTYKAKITYLRSKVDVVTIDNQIQIIENPTPVNISDFSVTTVVESDVLSSGNLRVSGAGNHFISNGNVGIGTTNPESLIHIRHSVNTDYGLKIQSNTWTDNSKALIEFATSGSSNLHGAYIGALRIPGGSGKSDIIFGTNSSNPAADSIEERLRIANNGNVGIGITTPDAKLAVNGNIHTKEVKVDLIGWSDFVFKKNYNLPTLKEVEQHIKEKGHLKDIPSADEVKKEGIYLGEMDSKLLQKIEELTLYTIDQDKRLVNQEKKINSLKEQNTHLAILKKENRVLKSIVERLSKIEKKLKIKNDKL